MKMNDLKAYENTLKKYGYHIYTLDETLDLIEKRLDEREDAHNAYLQKRAAIYMQTKSIDNTLYDDSGYGSWKKIWNYLNDVDKVQNDDVFAILDSGRRCDCIFMGKEILGNVYALEFDQKTGQLDEIESKEKYLSLFSIIAFLEYPSELLPKNEFFNDKYLSEKFIYVSIYSSLIYNHKYRLNQTKGKSICSICGSEYYAIGAIFTTVCSDCKHKYSDDPFEYYGVYYDPEKDDFACGQNCECSEHHLCLPAGSELDAMMMLSSLRKARAYSLEELDSREEIYDFIIFKCKDCGDYFKFTAKEYYGYKKHGLEPPKRCKACRDKRKHNKI